MTASACHPPSDRRAECRYVKRQFRSRQADDPTAKHLPLPGEYRCSDQQDRYSPTYEDRMKAFLTNRYGSAGSVSDADVTRLFSWSHHRPE
jgi:hypothetical protein